MGKVDVGLVWAKLVNIWGQLGTVAGMANTVMLVGVFYTTTVYPNTPIPLWVYLFTVVTVAILAITFIVKYGISGYYRYFSKQSELSEVNKKVSLIMDRLGIEEGENNDKPRR